MSQSDFEFAQRARLEATDNVRGCTIPIATLQNAGQSGPVIVVGTAVYLAVDDARFLITAAHTLRLFKEHGVALCIPDSTTSASHLEGEYTLPDDDHPWDVAVVRLHPDQAAKVEALGFQAIRAAEAYPCLPKTIPPGGFLVVGYPTEGSTEDRGAVKPVGFMAWCLPYTGPTDDFPRVPPRYEPDKHLLLAFDRGRMVNEGTATVPFPDPGGMSGCGVWWVDSDRDGLAKSKLECRLVGIQSSFVPQGPALKVMPISYPLWVISQRWPELKPALDLVRGRMAVFKP